MKVSRGGEVQVPEHEAREVLPGLSARREELRTRYRTNIHPQIDQVAALDKLSDFHLLPQFHFHPLKGKRAGQYAISLSGMMRLIVTFEEGSETVVWIEEVSKHYGD